ncbi:transcriptional regulator, LacI family [Rhizobium sp. RU35A]|uniref:LacI family DNA-binding transcriptional regulator n=1 Tax=Rhizobium sp. RU35A TaxID=1907414 RepID=UPI0009565933|nr:LacI family DNA-binding transcriptional regulator [Rhizobium sp. RU35A]SIQ48013.1 transcriptional regulator, LacI family [Rhizobium sp. RU35A]
MAEPPSKTVITIRDVAGLAGVSQMTVSKVMRNVGNISATTRDKVLNAARELGYVPNSLAQSLSSRRSRLVAVIIPSMADVVFSEVLSGVNSVLKTQGLQTFIGESHFEPETEMELMRTMLSFQPAGLLLNGGMVRNPEGDELLRKRACPAIQLWDCEENDLDFAAGPSHEEAGRMVAERFLAQGVSRIAYIGTELEKDLCAKRRYLALRARLAEEGITLVTRNSEGMPRQAVSGRVLAEQLLAEHPDIQAIHFLNDAMALGGLSYLHEVGIQVPEGVSVIGFNGTSIANTVRTRLTTVDVPRTAIGEIAARALLDLVGRKASPSFWRAPLSLVEGNTTPAIR